MRINSSAFYAHPDKLIKAIHVHEYIEFYFNLSDERFFSPCGRLYLRYLIFELTTLKYFF